MSHDRPTSDAATGRPAWARGRVDFDRLFGVDGDWISRHRCREAEIVGPLRAAVAEHRGCQDELECLADRSPGRSGRVRSLERRQALASEVMRRLGCLEVRLIHTVTAVAWAANPARGDSPWEPVGIQVRPSTLGWLLLGQMADLEGDAEDLRRAFSDGMAERRASGAIPGPGRLLIALLLAALLRLVSSAREPLRRPPPHLHTPRVAAAGGDTCLYIPRA